MATKTTRAKATKVTLASLAADCRTIASGDEKTDEKSLVAAAAALRKAMHGAALIVKGDAVKDRQLATVFSAIHTRLGDKPGDVYECANEARRLMRDLA